MASPLSTFRKYQGPILVVLGVLLMVSFLIVPLVLDYQDSISRSGGVNRSQVVVRWDGGELREAELYNILDIHGRTMAFLQAVEKAATDQGGQPKVQSPLRRTNDEQIVIMLLLAEKARDMGVAFSDQALREYLDLLADNTLNHEDFNRLLEETTRGASQPLSVSELFGQLRIELLAMYMDQLADGAVRPWSAQTQISTPAQNWQRYQKLQQRAVLEMLPLPVADFVDQVQQTPSDAEIQELYEKYKDQFPDPNNPEPGFARLPEADFAYLKLDFNKFLEEEMAKITEEQIKAEYEKGLARGDYRIPQLPEATPNTQTPLPNSEPGAGEQDDGATVPPDSLPSESAPEDSGDNQERPPADPNSNIPSGAEEPTDSAPAEGAPAGDDQATDDEAADGSDCGPILQQEEEQDQNQDQDQEPSDDSVADPQDEEPPAVDPPTNDERPPAPPESADDSQTQVEQPEEQPAEQQPDDEQATGDEPDAGTPPSPEGVAEPRREHKTLEEVREDIVKRLASPQAQERQQKAEEDAVKQLGSFSRKYRLWEELKKEDPTRPEPEPPTAEQFAENLGLEFGHTGMVDYHEVQETVLGETSIASGNPFMPNRDFRDLAYGLKLFEPVRVTENENFDVSYIVWKVEETPQSIPTLKEARDDVVAAWKTMEARKLAADRAEELQQQASDQSGTLQERLPDQAEKVFQTNEFSWLRVANEILPGFGQLEYSSVEHVDAVNEEFMKDVFSKEENEIGVTTDAGDSVYYVFRVARLSPTEELLRERFLQELTTAGFRRSNMDQLAQADLTDFKRDYYRHLFQEFDVQWEQPPQQRFQ